MSHYPIHKKVNFIPRSLMLAQLMIVAVQASPITTEPTAATSSTSTTPPQQSVNSKIYGTVDYKQIRGIGDKKQETLIKVSIYQNLKGFDRSTLAPLDLKTFSTEDTSGVQTGHLGFRVNSFSPTKNLITEVLQVAATERFDPMNPGRMTMNALLTPFIGVMDTATAKGDLQKATPSIETLVAQIFVPTEVKASYPLVLMFPGSAGIRVSEELNATALSKKLGAVVFMPDLVRSFGNTSTLNDQLKQSIYGCGFSVWAAIAMAQTFPNVSIQSTALVGDSLGALACWMSLQPSVRSKLSEQPVVAYYDLTDLPRVITEKDCFEKFPANVRMTIRHGTLDDFFSEEDLRHIKDNMANEPQIKYVAYSSHHDGKAHPVDFPNGPARVESATQYEHLAITLTSTMDEIRDQLLNFMIETPVKAEAVGKVMDYVGTTKLFSLNKPAMNLDLETLKVNLAKLTDTDSKLKQKITSADDLIQALGSLGLCKKEISVTDVGELLKNLPRGATFGPNGHAQDIRDDVVAAVSRYSRIQDPQERLPS